MDLPRAERGHPNPILPTGREGGGRITPNPILLPSTDGGRKG